MQQLKELHRLLLKQNWTGIAAALAAGADANERSPDGTPIIASVIRRRHGGPMLHAALSPATPTAAQVVAATPAASNVIPFSAGASVRDAGEEAIGPLEIVRALIRQGADVNAAELDGGCALLSAVGQNPRGQKGWVYRDDLPLVELLIAAGADVNAHYTDQPTSALMVAARCGSPAIIALLLDKGAAIDWRGDGDCTALHFAVSAPWLADRPEVTQLLLDHGADRNARSIHGDRPADYARRHGHLASLALLD